jgi:hypothetical protein
MSSSQPQSPSEDPEKQDVWARRRHPGIRRTSSTISTSPATQSSAQFARSLSTASSQITQNLDRSSTLRVDDNAIHGYPKLAKFLGGQEGYAIYKRFASLNARNLLYHQAKLIRLEHELHDLEQDFAHEKDLHYKVHHMFDAASSNDAGKLLRDKYEEVSRALEKYNNLLLEQARLHALPSPDSTYVDSIHNFIHNAQSEDKDWLGHPENTIYAVWDEDRKPIQEDLVTLNPDFGTQDPFSRFVYTAIVDWWHKIWSRIRKPEGDLGEYYYQDKTLSRYISAITMIVASALPTCSIVALYFIQSQIWRLVFIVLFSGVFASALAFFTGARRTEIFMASVALASVQVVFVGTTFGSGYGIPTQ